ncbi:MAG: flagellar assembly protein FliW [Polyangiaceae bacterium]
MIDLEQTRFGDLSVPEESLITLRGGLLGFPNDTRFVLVERARGPVAFLQSVDTPALAVPVMDGSTLSPAYPTHPQELLARLAGVPADDLAISVVVAVDAADRSLRANLVAPIVINASTRRGSQIILPGSGYDTRTRILIVDQLGVMVSDTPSRERSAEPQRARECEEP